MLEFQNQSNSALPKEVSHLFLPWVTCSLRFACASLNVHAVVRWAGSRNWCTRNSA